MTSMFCCGSVQPYRAQILLHESKFKAFLQWARAAETGPADADGEVQMLSDGKALYAIQLVRQINYGALESIRYFIARKEDVSGEVFHEITERDLVDANYQKVNAYKNFKCVSHNKFFELNLYEKDPVNKHHWRANVARPAADIDVQTNNN